MPVGFVASGVAGSTNQLTVTTASIDTTGSTLLVAALATYQGGPSGTLSDAKSNTWTPLTEYFVTGDARVQLFYAVNPTVGAGHTATYTTASASYPALALGGFSGVALVSPFDGQNGAADAGTGTTSVTGSLTPTQNGDMVVSGLSMNAAGVVTGVSLGFAVAGQQTSVSAQCYGVGLAYLAQGTAGALNPTWTHGSMRCAATIAAFKVAPAVTVKAPPPRRRPPRFYRRAA